MKTIRLDRWKVGPDFAGGTMTCPTLVEAMPDLILATCEPPWKNNQANISCIPAGTYPIQYAWSDRWNRLMPHLLDVPFRDLIEVHIGNVPGDTEGCILAGLRATPTGVGPSTPAFQRFDAWLGRACRDHVQIQITDPSQQLPLVTV